MALLLPQCAPPESLHQLASIRQRLSVHRSRKAARATHGATESSAKAQAASTEHFKVPSTEPCCNLISPLVLTPRKPVGRRSSRLRVRKGREDDAKTDASTDMDAAEWISRVLANNGVVEVDPVTMAAQMNHGKHDSDSPHTRRHQHSASLTSSSEVSDYFPPPRGGPGFASGFPRVPIGVVLAAGSAVALATVSVLIQTLNRQSDGTIPRQFDSEEGGNGGNNFASDFTGEPVTPDRGARAPPSSPPHRTRDKKLPAEVLASTAGASAVLASLDLRPGSVRTGRSNIPSPPSLSKAASSRGENEKPPREQQQQRKYASVTPFFVSDWSSPASNYARPAPLIPKWQEDKYKSVPPFFSSDRLAAATTATVAPFFPDDQASKSENDSSSSSKKTAAPFFADERGGERAKAPSLKSVAPFFADEQQQQRSRSRNPPSLESVAPFFTDEQQQQQRSRSRNQPSSESVTPFFVDEQQQQRNRSRNGPSSESVTPLFADERRSERKTGSSSETVAPFFADERGSQRKSESRWESVTPFFVDERGSERKSESRWESVTPFFADERGSERKNESRWESVTPFFADEHRSPSTGVSQSKGAFALESVTPFFPDDQVGTSGRPYSQFGQRWDGDSSGRRRGSSAEAMSPDDLRGMAGMAGMAGKSQGGQQEALFMGGAHAMGAGELSPEELALLAERKAEEERRFAKMQALQSAFPALAIGAGAVGALVGVDGAFEMVGLTATASFISYELLWANKRQELLDEMSRITDHHKLFRFLQKRKIVKDDC